jgi:hypothetical protein
MRVPKSKRAVDFRNVSFSTQKGSDLKTNFKQLSALCGELEGISYRFDQVDKLNIGSSWLSNAFAAMQKMPAVTRPSAVFCTRFSIGDGIKLSGIGEREQDCLSSAMTTILVQTRTGTFSVTSLPWSPRNGYNLNCHPQTFRLFQPTPKRRSQFWFSKSSPNASDDTIIKYVVFHFIQWILPIFQPNRQTPKLLLNQDLPQSSEFNELTPL